MLFREAIQKRLPQAMNGASGAMFGLLDYKEEVAIKARASVIFDKVTESKRLRKWSSKVRSARLPHDDETPRLCGRLLRAPCVRGAG